MPQINGKQLSNGSIKVEKLDITNASAGNDPASRSFVISQLQSLMYDLDVKESVKVATTSNITLSGLQTIDGVSLQSGDRVLVKNQTTGSSNGIYIVKSTAWLRSNDLLNSLIVTPKLCIPVDSGTVNGEKFFKLTNSTNATIGTTVINFSIIELNFFQTYLDARGTLN